MSEEDERGKEEENIRPMIRHKTWSITLHICHSSTLCVGIKTDRDGHIFQKGSEFFVVPLLLLLFKMREISTTFILSFWVCMYFCFTCSPNCHCHY